MEATNVMMMTIQMTIIFDIKSQVPLSVPLDSYLNIPKLIQESETMKICAPVIYPWDLVKYHNLAAESIRGSVFSIRNGF